MRQNSPLIWPASHCRRYRRSCGPKCSERGSRLSAGAVRAAKSILSTALRSTELRRWRDAPRSPARSTGVGVSIGDGVGALDAETETGGETVGKGASTPTLAALRCWKIASFFKRASKEDNDSKFKVDAIVDN